MLVKGATGVKSMPICFQLGPFEQTLMACNEGTKLFIQGNAFEIIICKCTSFSSGLNVLIILIVAQNVLQPLVIEGATNK